MPKFLECLCQTRKKKRWKQFLLGIAALASMEAQPTEITAASQSDPGCPSVRPAPMETDQQDSPTVEEMPSHTDISTEPLPHGLLSQFREADGKLAYFIQVTALRMTCR